jgi:uncharacterized protein (DUF885 family)
MKNIIFLISIAFLTSCNEVKKESKIEKESASIDDIANQYIQHLFKYNPELGTFYQIENSDNIGLSDNSHEGLEKVERAEDSLFTALKSINPNSLDNNQNITYQLLKAEMQGSINQRICKKQLWSINHLDAFYTWYQYIGQTQPVGDSIGRAHTLLRWEKIPNYIHNDMVNNKKGLEEGYALPKPVVERVIEQMEQLVSSSIESNVFYMPALREWNLVFQNKIKNQIETNIIPEIKKYLNFMKDEYLPKARTELSISTIPYGNDCYAAMLSASTTLKNSPEEIYAWGEEAISERETTIKKLGAKLYNSDDLQLIKESFANDSSNYFETKTELLADAQSAINRAKIKSKDYFNLYPKADVILEPISEIEEKTGYSRYLSASDDGTRPATYIQATYQPKKQVKGAVESTAFHETYPGHHLQIAISRELVKSHPVTKYLGNSGFSEGWARYTETLSDEMGLYSSDNHRIAMYMGLPTGMVVDPGIHYKNWTREEAIDYTLSKQTSMTRQDAERYVDRISVWPGQMTTYGVGERFFMILRKKAEKELGKNFDIKEFHDTCLKNGTVPLAFLTEEVEEYIKTKANNVYKK